MPKTNAALRLVRNPETGSYVRPATVVASVVGGPLSVVMKHGGEDVRLSAVVALSPAPRLCWGDRVLVTGEDMETCYVIGVLETAAGARRVATREGAAAEVKEEDGGERIEVRDAEARLLFEYRPEAGRGVLSMPTGDLELHAPGGNIDLVSGGSVRVRGGEAVSLSAGATSIGVGRESAEISARDLKVASRRADFLVGEAVYRGERLSAAVEQVKTVTRKLETVAGWVFERAKSVFRKVEELDQLEAGRTRTLVEGSATLRAGSAAIEADHDVKIDGSGIHLG